MSGQSIPQLETFPFFFGNTVKSFLYLEAICLTVFIATFFEAVLEAVTTVHNYLLFYLLLSNNFPSNKGLINKDRAETYELIKYEKRFHEGHAEYKL